MPLPLQFIAVRDQDGTVAIGRDDLVRYAGPGQVVASALVLRLFARAFAELSPDGPPHRDDIRVLTAFPGQGVIDGIEMVTRARTRGRLTIDPEAGPDAAPASVGGRMYFEVAVGPRARGYWLADGFFTEAFIADVRRYQDAPRTAAEEAAYQMTKHALIGRLLGTPGEALFHAREVPPPAG